MPSKIECGIGSPPSTLEVLERSPRDGATPKPWLLCMLRLCAAISPYDDAEQRVVAADVELGEADVSSLGRRRQARSKRCAACHSARA